MLADVHISIVSHNHEEDLLALLQDFAQLKSDCGLQITLTFNTARTVSVPKLPWPIRILQNKSVKSFAENHNRAFNHAPRAAERRYFVILNPDTRLHSCPFAALSRQLEREASLGVLAPLVYDQRGRLQENGRRFPNLRFIVKKLFHAQELELPDVSQAVNPVDWVAGMCMVMRASSFELVGGFDTAYRLYYEDVDLCLRLKQQHLSAAVCSAANITHIGQWASRRNPQYFFWHLSSLLRFLVRHKKYQWNSPASTA